MREIVDSGGGHDLEALLQQGGVLRFEKQVGAMLIKDLTIMKFKMSAIWIGMVGVHLAVARSLAQLSLKATQIGAIVVGGLLFGPGWTVIPILGLFFLLVFVFFEKRGCDRCVI